MVVASPTRHLARVLALLLITGTIGCRDESPVEPNAATFPKLQVTAATIVTVTNTDDAGPGSLRQAIADAAPGSVIQFAAPVAGQTIVLSTGQLTIDKALTIEGPLATGMTVSGGFSSRVFSVAQGADVTLRNLSIVNGRAGAGGGIANGGKLTLDHAIVANNEATSNGAGIQGGGDLTILNSTISGNASAGRAGGIESKGPLTLRNVTIADNTSYGDGGGLFAELDLISIRNSIIANNANLADPTGANCEISPTGTAVFSGINITNGNCATDPAIIDIDPKLGPLANNGGPTKTYALLLGSPAIDAGTLCSEATDQRYVVRNQGTSCDVGAFEFNDYGTFTITIGPNLTVNAKTGVLTASGTISCSRPGFANLAITLSQTQKVNGRFTSIAEGAGGTLVSLCGTTPSSWTAAVTPSNGKFQNGTATGRVRTTTFAVGFLAADVTASVKLFNSK